MKNCRVEELCYRRKPTRRTLAAEGAAYSDPGSRLRSNARIAGWPRATSRQVAPPSSLLETAKRAPSLPSAIAHVIRPGHAVADRARDQCPCYRYGAPVQMMQLNHGIFDEASISVIASDTVREIGRLAGRSADVRRFRPNIVVRSTRAVPFEEDQWLGGVLNFGEADDAPAVTVTMRDVRCGHRRQRRGLR